MDSLEECGVRYLTASAIQQWRESPSVWALGALYGLKDFKVPAVARHIAVRDSIKHWLYGSADSDDVLFRVYNQKLSDWGLNPAGEAERSEEDTLLALKDGLVKEIQGLGLQKKPLASGIASSVLVAGLDTPLLSVADFVFEDAQLKVKTGKRLPSKIQPRDMMALALDYRARRDRHPCIVYATAKKAAPYWPTCDELAVAFEQLCDEAKAMETLVKTATSREHLLAMLPMNRDHFLWKPALQEARLEIVNNWRDNHGFVCTEVRELSERPGGLAHLDLLPDAGFGDAEGGLEWGD